MSVEIPHHILVNLENKIPEIRYRALNSIESKIRNSHNNWDELDVNPYELVKYAIKWFRNTPLTDGQRVLRILLEALESKYQRAILKHLNKKIYYTELKRISELCNNDSENVEQKLLLKQILTILENFRKEELCNLNDSDIGNSLTTDHTDDSNSIKESFERIHLNNAGIHDLNDNVNRFSFIDAWEVPSLSDLNSLQLMKTSLTADADEASIQHALNYFDNVVNDFPGEYFLQPPFLVLDLMNLIELKDTKSCKLRFLSASYQLTKNLERRVAIRRLTKTYYCKDLERVKQCRKQITIGTYCYEMFRVVLHYLHEIYNTSKLHEINQCFYIFIELIELICQSANVCTRETHQQYHIDTIVEELSDFLKFIRESTSNFSNNEYKIQRNNSITLIYLICRLIMFKEEKIETIDWSGKLNSADRRTYDPKLYASPLNTSESTTFSKCNYTVSSSSSLSLTTRTYSLDGENSIWKNELELALLDYTLKHFYPDVHQIIAQTLKVHIYKDSHRVKVLLNIAENFQPAIRMLKAPQSYSDEKLIREGLKAINVLSLVQSNELVNKMFNSISNLAPQYDGNPQLKSRAEALLLRLFCHENIALKRLIYRLASEKMSYFFSCIMDGTTLISKSYKANISQCNFLGLPLTTDILVEIICFGLTTDDSTVISHAENILMLILRSKNLIPHFWSGVRDLLEPVLPLLQCFASRKSSFGQLILDLSDPDSDCYLPTVRLIQTNIILLFSRDARVREESLYRLSYILQNTSNAHLYIPNINYLSDVVPNNVCIVDSVMEPNRNSFNDLFDKLCLPSMLKLLNSPDVEPSIRKTTIVQMSVLFQDPQVVKYFYEIDGVKTILEILDNSLRESAGNNYADNVIPIISMIAKLCLHLPHVRRQLSKDANLFLLLLRALFVYHHDEALKTDCSFALYSIAFCDYLVGSSLSLTLPYVCRKLMLPFKAEFHSHKSSTAATSPIETLLFDDTPRSVQSTVTYSKISNEQKLIWQFLRINFASIWFGSLDNIKLPTSKTEKEPVLKKPLVDYSIEEKPLSFNAELLLKQVDLDLIKSTSPRSGIEYWLRYLRNSTSQESVELSCAAIENFSNIDVTTKKLWDTENILNALKRYCTISPHSEDDKKLFGSVLRLLGILVERDFRDIHIWLLNEFQKKNCLFLKLLADKTIPSFMFLNVAKFIELVLIKTLKVQSNETINQNIQPVQLPLGESGKSKTSNFNSQNLYEKIFDLITNELDDVFKERDLERLRAFISILALVASSMQINKDDYTVSCLANKLLRFITAMKALAQTGAHFNKNCLLLIGNLMLSTNDLRLDKKHIRLLSNLCGHGDFEMRAYSWSILTKVSNTVRGAECLIKELRYLPGGFHACCLSTILDEYEPSIVRVNAALTFATLISYRSDNGQLDERVTPVCNAMEEGIKLGFQDKNILEKILNQHKFFTAITSALDRFYGNESIGSDEFVNNEKLTSPDLIRAICVILGNLLMLKLNAVHEFLFTIVMKLIRIIPQLFDSINKSSILMLTELCMFMSNSFTCNPKLMEHVAREAVVVKALVALLNMDLYENISKNIKCACWSQILIILTRFATTPIGFQTICDSFNETDYFGSTFNLLIYGLTYEEITIRVLKFLSVMLVVSQMDGIKFKSFAQYLNEMYVDDHFSVSASHQKSAEKPVNNNNDGESNISDEHNNAAEILFSFLNNLFENSNKTGKLYENVCKTIEALLKCSPVIRNVCGEEGFLLKIADQLEEILDNVGTNSQEYIRRHGNAKAEKILHRIKTHLNIMLSWYSIDCLKDPEFIDRLLKVFIFMWPWMNINFDVQQRFMKLLSFLSEDSLPVCKGLATITLRNSQTLLQLLIEHCVNETNKARTPQGNLNVLDLNLRVISHCCSCIEGRSLINKTNMLHTLSRLHPQVTKQQKPWNQITLYWLQFYEILTRYTDVNCNVKHLNFFRVVIESSYSSELRYHSLEIIRNFSFNVANRSGLLASDDYLYIVQLILDNGTINEQLLVVSSIWKLIAQHFKGRHVIKNSKINIKLRKLHEKLLRGSQKNIAINNFNNECGSSDIDKDVETLNDLKVALSYVLNILST